MKSSRSTAIPSRPQYFLVFVDDSGIRQRRNRGMYPKTRQVCQPCHRVLVDLFFLQPEYEIAFAMAKTSYSGEIVRSSKKVILIVPGTEIAEAVMGCGSTTGRDTDKVARCSIELAGVEGSEIKIPVRSRVAA